MLNIDTLFDDENKNVLAELEASNMDILKRISEEQLVLPNKIESNNFGGVVNRNSQPHSQFKLDWSSYGSFDFGNTFLPNAPCEKFKALWIYDAAELFGDLRSAQDKQFRFQQYLFNLWGYTYPEGSEAGNAKKLVEPNENDVCAFMEMKDNDIDINFRLGSNFKKAITANFASFKIPISEVEKKSYGSSVEDFKKFFRNGIAHSSMMLFILKTIGINDITSLYKLQSSFAQQQLKLVASEMGKLAFSIFMQTVFGESIEKKALFKLFHDLENDKLIPPEIVITEEHLKSRNANYNRAERKIYVWDVFIDRAWGSEEIMAELLVALVEEYGHHIDNLLRTDYSKSKRLDTDNIDEGAKFSLFFLTKTSLDLKEIKFGTALTPLYTGDLITQMSLVKKVANEIYDGANLRDENPNEKLEGFGSGFSPGTHGGFELEALQSIYAEDDIYKVYYGNWLRDYSQLIVGTLVKLTDKAKKLPEPESPYAILTHEGWVNILEILAAKELVFDKATRGKQFCHQYKDYVDEFRKKYGGALSIDLLGIYRPEEHIDNPKGQKDESHYPISFLYEFEKGKPSKEVKLYAGETSESFEIDVRLNMKKYIHIDIDPLRPSSDTFIMEQVMLAAQYGKNVEGYRHMGAALHVVEDFFAHTNYVEIELIKIGTKNLELVEFKKVYPWVQNMKGEDFNNIPIVTGIFLTDDTIASVLPKVADKIFPIGFNEYEQRKPGDRTFGDAFIITLLTDLVKSDSQKVWYGFTAQQWLDAYNAYLALVDLKSLWVLRLGPLGKFFDWILQKAGEMFSTFNNLAYNILLGSTDEDIKEEQTMYSNKNYGTDPTHTQIAKDPVNHPLNALAGLLASEAIKDIVLRVEEIWKTGNDASGINLAYYIINKYTKHPRATTWQDEITLNWAKDNIQLASRLQSDSVYEYVEKSVKRTVNNSSIKKLIK